MSQDRLAAESGVSRWSLSQLEAGRTLNPRVSTLTRLAQALGLEAADLLLGPARLDLLFGLPVAVELGLIGSLEERARLALASCLPRIQLSRISMHPWSEPARLSVVTGESSVLGVRVPLSLVSRLAELEGVVLPLAGGVRLGAPQLRPVRAAGTLRVLVKAPSREEAANRVRAWTTRAKCCPPIQFAPKRSLDGDSGSAWLATIRDIPPNSSVMLQQSRVTGPADLFVPG